MVKTYIEKKNELLQLAKEDYFFTNNSLQNNVPFYIFSYPPEEELKVRKLAEDFKTEIENRWHNSVNINLYEMILEILTTDSNLTKEDYIDAEKENWFEYLIDNAIPWILSDDAVEDKFFEKASWADLICVSNIWTVRPFLRAHLLLNRLASSNYINKNTKIVFFYPWEYKKNEKWQRFLSLFSEFSEWWYYRASAICE